MFIYLCLLVDSNFCSLQCVNQSKKQSLPPLRPLEDPRLQNWDPKVRSELRMCAAPAYTHRMCHTSCFPYTKHSFTSLSPNYLFSSAASRFLVATATSLPAGSTAIQTDEGKFWTLNVFCFFLFVFCGFK